MSTMGERIKAAREAKGLLQSQLAKLIGVKSGNVISNWELNLCKPDANKLVALCETLDVSLSFLLNYYGPEKKTGTAEAIPVDDLSNQIMLYVQKMSLEQKRALLASFQALIEPNQKQ